MKDIINILRKSDTWEVQLTIAINSTSSKDTDEEPAMHSKRDSIEIFIYCKADEVIGKLFESLLYRYQTELKTSMKAMN